MTSLELRLNLLPAFTEAVLYLLASKPLPGFGVAISYLLGATVTSIQGAPLIVGCEIAFIRFG